MTFLENIDKAYLRKILLIVISVLTLVALALLLVIIVMSIAPQSPQKTNIGFKEYEVTNEDINVGSLILADASHPYEVDEALLDLVGCTAYMESQPDAEGVGVQSEEEYYKKNYIPWKVMRLSKSAMAEAHKMLTDAKHAVNPNMPLTIDAAYDTIKHGDPSFEYNTALLILLSDYTSTGTTRVPLTEDYRNWLDANAAKYGFIESFEDAYRYVGEVHASYMTSKKLTLSDYISYLKENTSADRVLTVKTNGINYIVYYVPCKAGDTIQVPDGDYTISGTNEGGVVITARKPK